MKLSENNHLKHIYTLLLGYQNPSTSVNTHMMKTQELFSHVEVKLGVEITWAHS